MSHSPLSSVHVPYVPPELIAQIIDGLFDRQTLRSARLVSRTWCAFATPILFDRVEFHYDGAWLGRRRPSFKILHDPELHRHVRHVAVRLDVGWRQVHYPYPETFASVERACLSLSKLETFTWDVPSVPPYIPRGLLRSLRSKWPEARLYMEQLNPGHHPGYTQDEDIEALAPALVSLKCCFRDGEESECFDGFRRLLNRLHRLQVLEIIENQSRWSNGFTYQVPPMLQPSDTIPPLTKLVLLNLHSRTGSIADQARSWTKAADWSNLRHLELGSSNPKFLEQFLDAFSGRVPNLRHLSLSGKPVFSIRKASQRFVWGTRKLEGLETKNLSLHHPWAVINGRVPHLKTLRIESLQDLDIAPQNLPLGRDWKTVMENFKSAVSGGKLAELSTLEIKAGPIDGNSLAELIIELVSSLPSLTSLNFNTAKILRPKSTWDFQTLKTTQILISTSLNDTPACTSPSLPLRSFTVTWQEIRTVSENTRDSSSSLPSSGSVIRSLQKPAENPSRLGIGVKALFEMVDERSPKWNGVRRWALKRRTEEVTALNKITLDTPLAYAGSSSSGVATRAGDGGGGVRGTVQSTLFGMGFARR